MLFNRKKLPQDIISHIRSHNQYKLLLWPLLKYNFQIRHNYIVLLLISPLYAFYIFGFPFFFFFWTLTNESINPVNDFILGVFYRVLHYSIFFTHYSCAIAPLMTKIMKTPSVKSHVGRALNFTSLHHSFKITLFFDCCINENTIL